jgi:3-oxoacyl-[acyl-carrier protein] reductase
MNLLDDRVAVITGGARGIGLQIAHTYARAGAAVVIADIDAEAGAAGAAAVASEHGTDALAIGTDVSAEEDMRALLSTTLERHGHVDVMVNNAGVPDNAPLLEMDLGRFRKVIDVHLQGAWLGTREAARVMVEAGNPGSIINMSSIVGKVGQVEQTNYGAAKAGIVGLTKSAAKELGPSGIRVNAIQPGSIKTERTSNQDQARWARKIAEVPLGREGQPEEIASVALFLASELSSYMTGTVLEVAGGRYI